MSWDRHSPKMRGVSDVAMTSAHYETRERCSRVFVRDAVEILQREELLSDSSNENDEVGSVCPPGSCSGE